MTFTVMVGFEGSGNISTFRPFSRLYSVIPSTEVTFVTPFGNCCASEGIASITASIIPTSEPVLNKFVLLDFMTILKSISLDL